MSERISGQSIDFTIDGTMIHVEKINLNITDNTKAASTNGVPDGHVPGAVSADGEMEVSTKVLGQLTDIARRFGSWRGMPAVDFMFFAKAGNEGLKVEAFGCKLNMSKVVEKAPEGGALVTHSMKFEVTSPEFVRINGVPYLEKEATQDLIG